MFPRRLITALLASLAIPFALCAQDVSSAEFGRGFGGELRLLPKASRDLSGSLGFSMGRSSGAFSAFGTGKGYAGTLGGTLLRDRLWFFASGEQQESTAFRGTGDMGLPQFSNTQSLDAKVNARLGDRQSLAALFASGTSPLAGPTAARSSFLSLHYTSAVSSSLTFDANVTHRSSTQPDLSLWPGFAPGP